MRKFYTIISMLVFIVFLVGLSFTAAMAREDAANTDGTTEAVAIDFTDKLFLDSVLISGSLETGDMFEAGYWNAAEGYVFLGWCSKTQGDVVLCSASPGAGLNGDDLLALYDLVER